MRLSPVAHDRLADDPGDAQADPFAWGTQHIAARVQAWPHKAGYGPGVEGAARPWGRYDVLAPTVDCSRSSRSLCLQAGVSAISDMHDDPITGSSCRGKDS